MRYKADHKQQTRERILQAAARQFRARGFAQTGVAAVMKEADLTHGGFYAHFDNKEDLIAEVIRSIFSRISDEFEAALGQAEGAEWLRAWVDTYLSDEHRAQASEGCPIPPLAAEIARSGSAARTAFSQVFAERGAKICGHIDASREEAERRGLAAISQMAGALMISRALDEPLATRIREVAAEAAKRTLIDGLDCDETERGAK